MISCLGGTGGGGEKSVRIGEKTGNKSVRMGEGGLEIKKKVLRSHLNSP